MVFGGNKKSVPLQQGCSEGFEGRDDG